MPRRLLRPLPLALLAALATAPAAHATAVSYVDGGEVWVASLDGARRLQLTQPGALGPGRWQETAMSDNGRLAAQRREGNSMFTAFGLWGPQGQLLNASALPYEPGWTLYVGPIGFDLTDDGATLVYGFSNTRGFFPTTVFGRGFYAIAAETTRSLLRPFQVDDRQWPTVAGKRVVATDSGTQVFVQDPGGQPPYSFDFRPWITINGGWEIARADAASNGSAVGIELVRWNGGERSEARVLMAQTPSGLGGAALGDDCFLPTDGLADDVSLSPDGTRVAWKDAGGVKVAGMPRFNGPATCELSAPPVVISASGDAPSIGGMDLDVLQPPVAPPVTPPVNPPGGGGAGGGTPGGGGTGGGGGTQGGGGTGGGGGTARGGGTGAGGGAARAKAPSFKSLDPATRTGFRDGPTLRLGVAAAGRVTVSVTVTSAVARRLGIAPRARRAVVVASGAARAGRAGTVRVRLTPTRAAKRAWRGLGGVTLTVRAAQGRAAATKTVKLGR